MQWPKSISIDYRHDRWKQQASTTLHSWHHSFSVVLQHTQDHSTKSPANTTVIWFHTFIVGSTRAKHTSMHEMVCTCCSAHPQAFGASRSDAGHWHWLDIPDVLSILIDGAVRRKLATACCVQNAPLCPLILVSIDLVYFLLGIHVAGKVIC